MQEYKAKLYAALREIAECQVSMRTVEQATAVTELLCKLDKIEEHTGSEPKFDREIAMRWTQKMKNADGTLGPHWSLAQTEAYAQGAGVAEKYDKWVWFTTMNKEYSDGIKTAIKHGINRPEYFIDRAIEFLDDKDGPGPERKLMEYYEHIAHGTNTK